MESSQAAWVAWTRCIWHDREFVGLQDGPDLVHLTPNKVGASHLPLLSLVQHSECAGCWLAEQLVRT